MSKVFVLDTNSPTVFDGGVLGRVGEKCYKTPVTRETDDVLVIVHTARSIVDTGNPTKGFNDIKIFKLSYCFTIER
jgi:hypothetical protein